MRCSAGDWWQYWIICCGPLLATIVVVITVAEIVVGSDGCAMSGDVVGLWNASKESKRRRKRELH